MKGKITIAEMLFSSVPTVAAVVLGVMLFQSEQQVNLLSNQLEESQQAIAQESTQQAEMPAVRVINGVLQQRNEQQQWIDVAPVAELCQADPVQAGKEKMQALIQQNQEAVQNGTLRAEEISPVLVGKGAERQELLASVSEVQEGSDKTQASTGKPSAGTMKTETAITPPATVGATAPVVEEDSEDAGESSEEDTSGGGNDSADSGDQDNSTDSGDTDSGADSDADSGDGEDIGWTDEIL